MSPRTMVGMLPNLIELRVCLKTRTLYKEHDCNIKPAAAFADALLIQYNTMARNIQLKYFIGWAYRLLVLSYFRFSN